MASKDKTKKQPASEQDKVQQDQRDLGYAGSQDHQTGKVGGDPAQATPEQLKEDRERQRGSF